MMWRKSSWSMSNGDCVEVAFVRGGVWVRDSKRPGPVLRLSRAEWRRLVEAMRSDRLPVPR